MSADGRGGGYTTDHAGPRRTRYECNPGLPDGVLGSRFDPKWLFFGVLGYDGVITGYFEIKSFSPSLSSVTRLPIEGLIQNS